MSQNNKFQKATAIIILLLTAVVTGISVQDYIKMSKTEEQEKLNTQTVINEESLKQEIIKDTDSSNYLNAGICKVLSDMMIEVDITNYIDISDNESNPVTSSTEEIEEVKLAKDNTPYVYYEVYDSGNYYSMSNELQEYTYDLCVDYNITEYFTLILCQLYHESGYNSSAISPTNDYGIAQINKCNHRWLSKELGVTDFLDAKQSILCNVYLMSDYLINYGPESGLVCYNTGKPYSSNPYARDILEMWYNDIREIQQ